MLVDCPSCGFSHQVNIKAKRVSRHYAVTRHNGRFGFELELPVDRPVQEWTMPEIGIVEKITMSGVFASFMATGTSLLLSYIGVDDLGIVLLSLSSFCVWAGVAVYTIAYSDAEREYHGKLIEAHVKRQGTINLDVQVEREEAQRESYAYRFINGVGVTYHAFNDWVDGVCQGGTLAYNAWAGSGKPFTRSQYSKFLDNLAQLDITKKLPNGWTLTSTGLRTLNAYRRHLK